MMKELLNAEGPVIGFLDKAGQLILVSVLWLLGCLPIITIATSTAAMYYAVIKSVRRGQGVTTKEFLRSYRDNLGRGIGVTVTILAVSTVLVFSLNILQGQRKTFLSGAVLFGLILLVFLTLFISPVLSRFRIPFAEVWKLAFVMSLRFAHYALLLLAGAVVGMQLQVYVLPIPTVLILPGIMCYCATFLIEKVLRNYMPEKKENDNAWYYET